MPADPPMPKPSAKNDAVASPRSYEEAIDELERLVASLESGTLPLEEAIAAHRRGIDLTRYCSEVLARAEGEVRILEGEMLKAFPVEPSRGGTAYAAPRPGSADDE